MFTANDKLTLVWQDFCQHSGANLVSPEWEKQEKKEEDLAPAGGAMQVTVMDSRMTPAAPLP